MFQTPLPTELTLLILSYLPLSSIRSLLLADKEWASFVEQNNHTIYRNAAFVEGYVDARDRAVSVDELVANPEGRKKKVSLYSQNAMRGVQGWRNFCKRRKLIERSWAGRAESRIVLSPRPVPTTSASACDNLEVPEPAHYKRVHRIKVDENAGITIATTQLGGLVVRDLQSDAVLWELPMWYVRQYAHLEYGQGFMIFDRDDGNKEVWRRTAEIRSQPFSPSSSTTQPSSIDPDTSTSHDTPEPEIEAISAPDERQKHVVNYINHLTSNSPSLSGVSSSTQHSPNFKARFTPHAILHMPEITRAYRYVYPTLLVASLERAYLWDVRTGILKQMISGIQVIRTPETDDEDNHDLVDPNDDHDEDDGDGMDEHDHPPSSPPTNDAGEHEQLVAQDIDLLDVLPPYNYHNGTGHSPPPNPGGDPYDDDFSSESDDDEAVQLPRFLGLVRYVDLSERHVFFAGRYLLRIFSRETGRCVMDIPSTRWRYGKWRWEIASQESLGVGPGAAGCDSYEKAKRDGQGREVVRMPVRFSLEEYPRAGRVVIDQFIAVHVSSDGKHLVGLLSGSRIVIIHNFEFFLGPAVDPPTLKGKEASNRYKSATVADAGPLSSPISNADSVFTMPGSFPSTSTSSAIAGPSNAGTNALSQNDPRARRRQARRLRRLRNKEARETRRRAKDAKEEEIFEHTIDVQLGAPASSSGIYLAYENGRIGVVTSNAVYIVIPPVASPPISFPSSTSVGGMKNRMIDVPKLEVMRVPFFSNPSWLNEVSCLMMSDTGLFLNWSPLWPRLPGDEVELAERVWEDDEDEGTWDENEDGVGNEDGGPSDDGGNGNREGVGSGSGSEEGEALVGERQSTRRRRDREWERQYENGRHEQMLHEWEREYEEDLVDYERSEGGRYHLFPNGDMFVTPRPRDVVESEVSTIYRVDFVPSSDVN